MNRDGFHTFLREREMSGDEIKGAIAIVERFETFLKRANALGVLETATSEDVNAFSEVLIQEKLNIYDNYVALAQYGRFVENNAIYVAVVELLDGSGVLENLHEELAASIGEQKRDEIFGKIGLPPLGTPSSQKPRLTHTVMDRLECMVGKAQCKSILSGCLHGLKDEWFLDEKKKYEECGNIDAYLERKRTDFIAELEKLRDEGGLYFTQEITDEVIGHVKSHPEVSGGVRDGNIIYETKIPYMTKEYLVETDERMKRYYYCHCAWVRESLRTGDVNVSPTFCYCSAGFHKKPYEVIFGQPLKAEVIDTVLDGGMCCKFAIHLPKDVV